METIIKEAISLREADQCEASRALLAALVNDSDYFASAHLHIAWSYDCEGNESDAIEHYKAAIEGSLPPPDRFDALLGLASSLRSLGEYEDALQYFELTIEEFPSKVEIKPFYAMCLYNVGRYKEATALLLEVLLSTTNSSDITAYQDAIELYAEDLDRKW